MTSLLAAFDPSDVLSFILGLVIGYIGGRLHTQTIKAVEDVAARAAHQAAVETAEQIRADLDLPRADPDAEQPASTQG